MKLVLELCAGGELFERIISKKHYSEKDASTLVRQMLEVVGACHVNGIIHRDLKPENFLFASDDEASELKVTDFGLSTFYRHGQRFTEVVGSAYYIAPEVLQRGYGPPCDIWSIGVIMCVCYILSTLFPLPFSAPSPPPLSFSVSEVRRPRRSREKRPNDGRGWGIKRNDWGSDN